MSVLAFLVALLLATSASAQLVNDQFDIEIFTLPLESTMCYDEANPENNILVVPVYITTYNGLGLRYATIDICYDSSYWTPLNIEPVIDDADMYVNLNPYRADIYCTGELDRVAIVLISGRVGFNLTGYRRIPFYLVMLRTGKAGSTAIKFNCNPSRLSLLMKPSSDPVNGATVYRGYGMPRTSIGNSCWKLRDADCQEGEVQRCDFAQFRRDCAKCGPILQP